MHPPSLRGTCAAVFQPDGAQPWGLDSVIAAPCHLGAVVSQSRDRRTIRTIEDMHGHRHQATPHTYRIDRYPCGLFAVLRTRPIETVTTVVALRLILREIIHEPWYRAAVIAHDLDRICECYARGWRRT